MTSMKMQRRSMKNAAAKEAAVVEDLKRKQRKL